MKKKTKNRLKTEDRLWLLRGLEMAHKFRPSMFDKDGKIIPDERAIRETEQEYPNENDADKWRLAQANMLIRWAQELV
jgi:hypothetical protein